MSERREIRWTLLFLALVLGCTEPAKGSDASGPAATSTASASGVTQPAAAAQAAAPRQKLALLGADERRVPVFVLPGDASVEVDGRLVARRDGVIEIVGKVGASHRIRVFKGAKSTEEKTITIQEPGAPPETLDLNEPPPPGAGKAGGAAKPVRFNNFDE